MIYYVYVYLREDGSPYYVGKGCNGRWKNKHKVEVPPRERVIFPITRTTEEWAFFVEMKLIDDWGRLDDGTGILENASDGGEQGPNQNPWNRGLKGTIPWNKGVKGAQIAWNKGIARPQSVKDAVSRANKGRIHSEETRAKLRAKKGGSKMVNAVLVEDDVIKIRTRRNNGERQCDVLRDYMHIISKGAFKHVWCDRSWKHVLL
jgi:hypothetical protein